MKPWIRHPLRWWRLRHQSVPAPHLRLTTVAPRAVRRRWARELAKELTRAQRY